jgi:uncharacterized protein YgiM (DUF1202 family)
MTHPNKAILLLGTLLVGACTSENKVNQLQIQILEIKNEFAPDKRVALFNVEAIQEADTYILRGESNLPAAIAALKNRLASKQIEFTDSIRLLPSKILGGKIHAIVNLSVANLRSNPGHSSELATQATLGTPVRVYKKDGNWYYVQTPDDYLAWVDAGGLQLLDDRDFLKWKKAEKILYLKTYGQSYISPDTASQTVSDLVAGDILEIMTIQDAFYKVRYPDGREAYILKNEAQEYDSWLESLHPTAESLLATSKSMMGVPYLWGGTSTKGLDCSGFTKTIYFLNGMVLPRDASQQVHSGKPIDSTRNFRYLEVGDLLFFGQKATDSTAEKVVHVGMWIGNNEFIHASEMVRISSMDRNAKNFDEWNFNRYLRTKRILKEKDAGLIHLNDTPIFKD